MGFRQRVIQAGALFQFGFIQVMSANERLSGFGAI